MDDTDASLLYLEPQSVIDSANNNNNNSNDNNNNNSNNDNYNDTI